MAYPRGRRTPLKRKATYGRGTKRFARSQYRRAYFNRRRGVGRKEKKGCDIEFYCHRRGHNKRQLKYLSLERDPRRGWIMEQNREIHLEQIHRTGPHVPLVNQLCRPRHDPNQWKLAPMPGRLGQTTKQWDNANLRHHLWKYRSNWDRNQRCTRPPQV